SVTSRVAGRLWQRGEFIDRYVFPDGELVPVASVIASAERSGFELRDIESLREHYVLTLRHWIRRLESHREEAIALVGEPTYRVWRLYMSASAYGFRTGRIGIIQSLLAKPRAGARVAGRRHVLVQHAKGEGRPRLAADASGLGDDTRVETVDLGRVEIAELERADDLTGNHVRRAGKGLDPADGADLPAGNAGHRLLHGLDE